MTNKTYLTEKEVAKLAKELASKIVKGFGDTPAEIYPIPRGGVPTAYLMTSFLPTGFKYAIVDKPEDANMFIDDIIDSGETMCKYCDEYSGIPFVALIDKTDRLSPYSNDWVVFPWEVNASGQDEGIEDNIRRLLQIVEPATSDREGLKETPARVAKAYAFWTSGYNVDIGKLLKVFEDGGENYDEMVIVKNIPIYSKCEHHLADIFGTATIAYIPNGKIVGLSKLSRVADAFARRLQVQERLTAQIADALVTHLNPKGVGVIVKARHMCMESRGLCQQGHHTETIALRGVMKSQADTRAEFLGRCS